MIKVANKLLASPGTLVIILVIVLVLSVLITLLVSNFVLKPETKQGSQSQGVVTVIVAPKESQDQGVVTVIVGGKNG